jgi:hypothetical protein
MRPEKTIIVRGAPRGRLVIVVGRFARTGGESSTLKKWPENIKNLVGLYKRGGVLGGPK